MTDGSLVCGAGVKELVVRPEKIVKAATAVVTKIFSFCHNTTR